MARAESKMVMGYLPIEERHYPALFALIQSAMLLHPTRSGGEVKLWTVILDMEAWTRLITGGLAQKTFSLHTK